MRAFFALPLPERARTELTSLRADVGTARWAPAEQLHVTLRFFADLDETQAEALLEALSTPGLPRPGGPLRARGLGTFGAPARPSVLWAGLDPEEPVRALAIAIEGAVRALGLPRELRPFSPHVTLARLSQPDVRRLAAFLRRGRAFSSSPFEATEVVLYRSTLGPGGAVHEPWGRVPLSVPRDTTLSEGIVPAEES
jgi:2'-5' RNA ligase